MVEDEKVIKHAPVRLDPFRFNYKTEEKENTPYEDRTEDVKNITTVTFDEATEKELLRAIRKLQDDGYEVDITIKTKASKLDED